MNREDIIRIAREAGARTQQNKNCNVEYLCSVEQLKRFAALVAAAAKTEEREQGQKWFDAVTAQHKQEILAEREACAKVCYRHAALIGDPIDQERIFQCAAAIRARGETK